MRVAEFKYGNFGVSFQASEQVPLHGRTPDEVLQDEDRSTSSRRITGLVPEVKDGWKNPNLWPTQGGKILKFDGSLE